MHCIQGKRDDVLYVCTVYKGGGTMNYMYLFCMYNRAVYTLLCFLYMHYVLGRRDYLLYVLCTREEGLSTICSREEGHCNIWTICTREEGICTISTVY